jgi:hypothetical protein
LGTRIVNGVPVSQPVSTAYSVDAVAGATRELLAKALTRAIDNDGDLAATRNGTVITVLRQNGEATAAFTGTLATSQQAAIGSASVTQSTSAALAEGLLTFGTGPNAGHIAKVRSHASGVVVLATDLPYLPVLGDEFDALAGCRKRLDEDCATKFSNERRFQGEPHRPTIDSLTSSPEPAA